MFSTIAVGTDGSATASEAVREAAEIARRHEAKLVLLSAFQHSPSPKADEDIEVQWASSSSARMQSMLEQTAAELGQEGIDCRTLSGEGDPAEVLVRLAADCGADLLVIGNKGMKRRVLGSVPNTVTHKAECSVLVIKTT
jgi:nucleotide-binding universal stress UspA family protein